MNAWAQGEGQPGLGYIFFRDENGQLEGAGPIAKNIGPERTTAIRTQLCLKDGDAVFFVCGRPDKFYKFAGEARTKAGVDLKLLDVEQYAFCWIVDFPMFEWLEEEKKVDFSHNPFSMPQGGLEALEHEDPLTINAYQYDIVCNGIELSSGAIRNHRPDIMYKAFEIAGYSNDEPEAKFGGMIRALQLGPCRTAALRRGWIASCKAALRARTNLRDVTGVPHEPAAEDLSWALRRGRRRVLGS